MDMEFFNPIRILTPRVAFPALCVGDVSDNAWPGTPALGLGGRRKSAGLESRKAKRYTRNRIQAAGIAR